MPIRVCPSRRHRRVSDQRAAEDASPYGADLRPPVGSDPQIDPPTCARVRQAGGDKPRPYGLGGAAAENTKSRRRGPPAFL